MTALDPADRPLRGASRNWHLDRRDVLCVVLLTILVLSAVFAPLVAPHDPGTQDLTNAFAGNSLSHPFGTDDLGRDTLSRMIHGARPSLLGPLVVVSFAVLLGTPLALASAWYGGVVDGFIGRLVDLLLAFPGILLAALATALFRPGLMTVSIALGIAYLPVIARITRSSALRERAKPYVASCEVQGMSSLSICVRHIAPNIAPVLISQATVLFGYAIVDVAALSFLGFGVQPPASDWGLMVNSQTAILAGEFVAPLVAGLVIVAAVLAVGRLGNSLGEERA